jgi:hypothetical protein
MRLVGWIAASWAVSMVAVACGGSSSSTGNTKTEQGGDSATAGSGAGGDASGGITFDQVPDLYATALCQAIKNCYGDLIGILHPGEDCAKNTSVELEEAMATLQASIDSGAVKYHGDKVQACLDEISGGDCSILTNRAPASCKAALAGTVDVGGDCQRNDECIGDHYCKVTDKCPGKCAEYEVAGGACASNDQCKSGLKCASNGHCVTPAQDGEACKQGEPDCVDGFVCLGDDAKTMMPGKCIAADQAFGGKKGGACALKTQLCQPGLACEITAFATLSGQCVAKLESGAVCHAAVPDECPDDQYCALASVLMPGKCTAKPGPGEKCAPGLGDEPAICAPYARCDSGVCRALAHAGENCTDSATCYSNNCIDKACVTGSSCQ